MLRLLAVLAVFCFASTAQAQTYPEPRGTTVNDYADMLSEEVEARVTTRLEELASDGTELTVVTLSSVQFYANNTSVDDYATGLFNAWGVGDPDKGDGILFLVFRDDRLLRVETGTGYDENKQEIAQNIISDVIIPEFQNGKFEAGIENGVNALAIQMTATDAAPASGENAGGGNMLYYILGGIAALIAAVVGINRRNAAKLAATPCASCGKTGTLRKENVTIVEATQEAEGKGERRTICSDCGHTTAEPYTISKARPADDKPEFKGGKSDGGGATGKW